MQFDGLGVRYKRDVFLALSSMALLSMVTFAVLHYFEDALRTMWIVIAMALLTAVSILALFRGTLDRTAYRFFYAVAGVGLLATAALGPSHLYYQLIFPLFLFFFFGHREGTVWSGAFLAGMLLMLLTMDIPNGHVQEAENVLKLTLCYLFVSIVAWSHEELQKRFYVALETKNEQLGRERDQLTDTLNRISDTESRLERANIELREKTELMETVFNTMSEGIVVADPTGRQLLRNLSAERISVSGLMPVESTESSGPYGIFFPDRETPVPADRNPLLRTLEGESIDGFEAFVRNGKRPDGVYISGNGRPIRNPSTDEISAGVIVFRDITQQKKAETELEKAVGELREQGELMEAMFNSVSDGIVVTGMDGEFLFVNPRAESMVGMGATDASSDEWSETYGTYYPDGERPYPSGELPLVRAMRGEAVDDVELLIRNQARPEGVHISVNARPLRDDAGELKGGMIVLRDITALKRTETELRQTVRSLQDQTRLMETIFNSISDGVVAADEYGSFTVFNPSAERIMGIGSTDTDPDQWSGHYGIFFPDRETAVPTDELPLVRAIAGQPSDELEMFIRNPSVPDGVYVSSSGRPLVDDSGTPRGGVVVFRDVTDRMLAEEALVQAFSQGRLEIVDTILHNIGNAINSVSVGVGTIAEELAGNELVSRLSALGESVEAHRDDWIPYLETDPQGQQVLPFILALAHDFSTQNTRLENVVSRVRDRVDHIVDIIRTERLFETEESMTRKDVDLERAIVNAVKLLQESLSKRGIRVHVDCKGAPEEIRIQESRFHQMLVNLTMNAMEAIGELAESGGLEGEPCIRIRAYAKGEFLVLDVIDNGVGIEAAKSRLVFAAGYSTKERGSGLGLHSTANFVIGSGGRISALSDGLGKGTTMRVELRLSPAEVQPRS